jgi:aminoglycoside phosphotransferase (APT) family kinase protein
VAKSYRQLLEDVFSDGLLLARKNPHVNEDELLRIKGMFERYSNAFEHSTPSFVHHDFWYKNILVDKNGFTGVIDFEFFGQVPVQVELFTFLHSRLSAKNYLDAGSEDYVELEFLEMLLSEIETNYPELKSRFNTGEFLLYNACKYVSMLTKWEESWYSHHETIKFYDTFLKEGLGE